MDMAGTGSGVTASFKARRRPRGSAVQAGCPLCPLAHPVHDVAAHLRVQVRHRERPPQPPCPNARGFGLRGIVSEVSMNPSPQRIGPSARSLFSAAYRDRRLEGRLRHEPNAASSPARERAHHEGAAWAFPWPFAAGIPRPATRGCSPPKAAAPGSPSPAAAGSCRPRPAAAPVRRQRPPAPSPPSAPPRSPAAR